MNKFELVIKHDPIPWKRPGQLGKYRYDTQANLKRKVGYFFKKAMAGQPPYKGPIALIIRLYFRPPLNNKHFHKISKGDVDNYAKFYMDCMTDAGVWIDDAQVFDLHVTKYFIFDEHSLIRQLPYVYFEVKELAHIKLKGNNERKNAHNPIDKTKSRK